MINAYGNTIAPPKPAPVETVTPISPSEALRLGRMLYPKFLSGGWREIVAARRFLREPKVEISLCPLGAMAVGYGWNPYDDRPDVYLNPHLNDLVQARIVYNVDKLEWTDAEVLVYLDSIGL